MEIKVRHETRYHYDRPLRRGVMLARLWPGDGREQAVRNWKVEAPGRFGFFDDHHGNRAATLTLDQELIEVAVIARGLVETRETNGVRDAESDPLPPRAYLKDSPYCLCDDRLREFAERSRAPISRSRLDGLHALMNAVHEAVAYDEDGSEVTTTAAEALSAGQGVCQDHAHIFIACCRHLDIPARYVSGYLASDDGSHGTHGAGHAWAEALVEGLGWVSFDPANGKSATEHYLRLAQGFDYRDAGPLRGLRHGGGSEALHVEIQISACQ